MIFNEVTEIARRASLSSIVLSTSPFTSPTYFPQTPAWPTPEEDEEAWVPHRDVEPTSAWDQSPSSVEAFLNHGSITKDDHWSLPSPFTEERVSPSSNDELHVQGQSPSMSLWKASFIEDCGLSTTGPVTLQYAEQSVNVEGVDNAALYAPVSSSGRDSFEASDRLLKTVQIIKNGDHVFHFIDDSSVRARNGKKFGCVGNGERNIHEEHKTITRSPGLSGLEGPRRGGLGEHRMDEGVGAELRKHVLQLRSTTSSRPLPLAYMNVECEQASGKMTEAQRRLGCFSPSTLSPARPALFSQSPYSSSSHVESYTPSPVSIGSISPRNTESMDQARARLYAMFGLDRPIPGLYHCPFKDLTACEHQASRSRSDCEQYIDSHMKPYRCTFSGCGKLRFSSLACRLRHEKEAHGAHGHGLRPFHCLFSDCERSLPGHGFPRHWNRNDHMKRVHGHTSTKRRNTEDAGYVDPAALSYASLTKEMTAATDEQLRSVTRKRQRRV